MDSYLLHSSSNSCTAHISSAQVCGVMTLLGAFSHMYLCHASPRHVVIDHCMYVSHTVGRISLRLISMMTALSRRTRLRWHMLHLQGTTPRDSTSCTSVRACRHPLVCTVWVYGHTWVKQLWSIVFDCFSSSVYFDTYWSVPRDTNVCVHILTFTYMYSPYFCRTQTQLHICGYVILPYICMYVWGSEVLSPLECTQDHSLAFDSSLDNLKIISSFSVEGFHPNAMAWKGLFCCL